MPAVCTEKFESRRVSTGRSASAEMRYVLEAASPVPPNETPAQREARLTLDENDARKALVTTSPLTFDIYGDGTAVLVRSSLQFDPAGPGLWEGVAHYDINNDASFSFETSGGTQHITQSIATRRYAPSGKTTPDFKGAIGVTKDGVEGVDITVPAYQWSESYLLPVAMVTSAYKGQLFLLTGKVNDAAFKGTAAGETLFLGACGGKRGPDDWEVCFRFASYPNVTGLTIGEVTGIDKKGWEYLWCRYEDAEDSTAKAMIKKVIGVYVEQVYPYGNLTLLGIGT